MADTYTAAFQSGLLGDIAKTIGNPYYLSVEWLIRHSLALPESQEKLNYSGEK